MGQRRRLREFLNWEPEFPTPIISKGLMYKGSKVIVYGKYKSFKSMLVQKLALALSSGEDWLGFNTSPQRVMYLQLEISEALLHRRFSKMAEGYAYRTNKDLIIWTEHFMKIDTPEGLKLLEEALEEDKPEVLIIDPIYKIVMGNMLEAQAMVKFLDIIDTLIHKYEISVIMVSHSRKPSQNEKSTWGTDDMLGSVFFSAWADSVIKVERGQDTIMVKFEVVRNAEEEIGSWSGYLDKDLQLKMGPKI